MNENLVLNDPGTNGKLNISNLNLTAPKYTWESLGAFTASTQLFQDGGIVCQTTELLPTYAGEQTLVKLSKESNSRLRYNNILWAYANHHGPINLIITKYNDI